MENHDDEFFRHEFFVFREDHQCATRQQTLGKWCSRRQIAVLMTLRPYLVTRQRRVRGILAIRPWSCRHREMAADFCTADLL